MTASLHTSTVHTVKSLSLDLTGWLVDSALPVWSEKGIDSERGTCHEAIELATLTGTASPCRARVVARQIYSFLEGAKLGWTGPAEDIVTTLHDWYAATFLSEAGHFAAAVDSSNNICDPTFDLYNQAFSLFGFAQVAAALPARSAGATELASNLLKLLLEKYRHPETGFREDNPDRLPLRSNPHMHLFEACLAWESVSDDPAWRDLSDEIAELALTRFIDPVSGGLREFFAMDWSPSPDDTGRTVEPGHQFEWAWLLVKWGQARGDAGALIAARRLYDIGWTYGIDESRGVAFMALNDDFTVRDPLARLWAQTEWIKAAVALARLSSGPERDAYLADIPDAVRALQTYFEDVPAGLWRDKMTADGTFVEEASPASSLYHIVCAISELDAFARSI
ncbi:AGE family epimerase/isomerase [Roseibium sediminicola]|uniref:AGE family epimerase/isomerase n=1 Tax=Roseibium sediminicola TaxID=2933272 RepID=A0ABT0GS92_9HYPH|nr:AGE family epimerase/isomerase [Roseibium sp. CAU 1639]MCK7612105.1 AGE family epimerase/isomerase [Roseibium sp. CAU 1639]